MTSCPHDKQSLGQEIRKNLPSENRKSDKDSDPSSLAKTKSGLRYSHIPLF